MRECRFHHLMNKHLSINSTRFRFDFAVQPSATASKKKRGLLTRELEGWIFAGSERIPVETKLVVKEKVFELEKVGEAKRIFRDGRDGSPPAPEARPVGPECVDCKGIAKRKCKTCGLVTAVLSDCPSLSAFFLTVCPLPV